MSGSIYLSPKHGVNSSIMVCFFCGDDMGVALPGRMRGDVQAPHRAVWDYEPCERCKGYMKQGIIFIGVDESKSDDKKNPYRSGKFAVLREEAVKRIVTPPELLADILQKRVTFITDETWRALRLP